LALLPTFPVKVTVPVPACTVKVSATPPVVPLLVP
jgi:hypothetical protein